MLSKKSNASDAGRIVVDRAKHLAKLCLQENGMGVYANEFISECKSNLARHRSMDSNVFQQSPDLETSKDVICDASGHVETLASARLIGLEHFDGTRWTFFGNYGLVIEKTFVENMKQEHRLAAEIFDVFRRCVSEHIPSSVNKIIHEKDAMRKELADPSIHKETLKLFGEINTNIGMFLVTCNSMIKAECGERFGMSCEVVENNALNEAPINLVLSLQKLNESKTDITPKKSRQWPLSLPDRSCNLCSIPEMDIIDHAATHSNSSLTSSSSGQFDKGGKQNEVSSGALEKSTFGKKRRSHNQRRREKQWRNSVQITTPTSYD